MPLFRLLRPYSPQKLSPFLSAYAVQVDFWITLRGIRILRSQTSRTVIDRTPRGRGRVLKFKTQINGTLRHNLPLCQAGQDRRVFADFDCVNALDTHRFLAVFVHIFVYLIPGAHGQLVTAYKRAALSVDISSPVAGVGGIMRSSKFHAQAVGGFTVSQAAQLAVYRHRRAAHKLKLPDMPAGRPGRNGGGGFFQLFTAFIIQLTVQRVPVDIFRNVFRDVPCRAAFLRIDRFSMEAGFTSLFRGQLVGVLLVCIIAHYLTHLIYIFRAHKHQHVPVRRGVMVRLGHPNAKNTDVFAVQFGADFLPDTAKIALSICRAGTIPFAVAMAGFDCGVIARRRGQRIELANKTHFGADIFKATYTGHQLTAADCRVSYAAVVFLDQADALAGFLVLQLHALEKFTGAALLFAPLDNSHRAGVRGVLFADVSQGNVQMLTP